MIYELQKFEGGFRTASKEIEGSSFENAEENAVTEIQNQVLDMDPYSLRSGMKLHWKLVEFPYKGAIMTRMWQFDASLIHDIRVDIEAQELDVG